MGQLPCKFDDCIGRLNLTNLVSYHASLKMMVLMAKMLKEDSYHASPEMEVLVNFKSDEVSCHGSMRRPDINLLWCYTSEHDNTSNNS